MIRQGFLSASERKDLVAAARDGGVAHRVGRRANAVVLLDQGMSCQDVGAVLLVDDDTIRTWYQLFKSGGISGLADFGHKGSACRLRLDQQEQLSSWVNKTLPRTTRMVGAWIEQQFGLAYQSRSGLVGLLHRLGMVYRKPEHLSRKLDESKQQAFIQSYSDLLNSLPDDEVVMFADAVHPTHSS